MVMSMQMTFVALSAIAEDYGVTLRAVTWVVIAQEAKALQFLDDDPAWRQLRKVESNTGWTDNYSNVFRAIIWSGGGRSKNSSPMNVLQLP